METSISTLRRFALVLRAGVLSLLWLVPTGCRSNCELVEADLRAKEAQLACLEQELVRRDCNIQALEMEIAQLQRQLLQKGVTPAAPGVIVKEVTLGRLTGGYDEDPRCPGDEGLQVLLEPRDCDDQSVKAPGALHLEVLEITPQGLKVPLCSYDFTPAELRRHWDTPVFGSPAYRLTVPWKCWPASDKLRVVAQFTTPDGQRYEADRDITVRLPDPTVRRRLEPLPPPSRLQEGPIIPPAQGPGPELTRPSELPTTSSIPSDGPPAPEPPTPPGGVPVSPTSYARPASPDASRSPDPRGAGLQTPIKGLWVPARRNQRNTQPQSQNRP